MKKISFFLFSIGLLAVTGCKKFLEKEPDNRTTVTSPEQVKQLLVSAYPKASYFPFTEPMTDNAEDKGQGVVGLDPELVRINLQSYMFQDVEATGKDSPEAFWDACYKAIASANQALEVIDKASDQSGFTAQKGEALVA